MSTRPPMTEERAKEILGDRAGDSYLDNASDLDGSPEYLSWDNRRKTATLDGRFTADELEAIAWWMHNKLVP